MISFSVIYANICDIPRVSGGELQSLLDRDEALEEQHVARLMGQILEAIAFLHSINVAHLDIKVFNKLNSA